MKSIDYEITNVAGVDHARLVLKPGVNILRAKNGGGKTSAINAITRAQGGTNDLERRDGTERGMVRGPGVTLRVGRVVRKTGTAELSLADVSPLARLIDPGLKDTDAAARARVKALTELLDVAVDEKAILALCDRDPELANWLTGELGPGADLTVAAEVLRRHLHEVARGWEAEAEEHEGRAKAADERVAAALETLGGEDGLVTVLPDEAQAALVEASAGYFRHEADALARADTEKRQAEIRESLGERPDVEAAERLRSDARSAVADAHERVTELEAQLAQARQEHAIAVANHEAIEDRHRDAIDAARRWDEQRALLDREVTGPAMDELPALREQTIGAAEMQLEAARASAEYRAGKSARDDACEAAAKATQEAQRLRGIAANLPARLGDLLADAGATGLTVSGGRLHAIVDGMPVDFERRLSEGQKVRAAVEVAARVYRGRVVPLAGEFWSSLDPEHRAEFARLAVEHGLFVITEEPATGDLRVDHVGEEVGEPATATGEVQG